MLVMRLGVIVKITGVVDVVGINTIGVALITTGVRDGIGVPTGSGCGSILKILQEVKTQRVKIDRKALLINRLYLSCPHNSLIVFVCLICGYRDRLLVSRGV